MPDLYIGKHVDPASGALGEEVRVDAADLTTHGIVIGMTGSGKTGLSVCIIEELLRARVPVIVVDPKGDMANLALAFDALAPDRFAPWIDRDEAAREGTDPAAVAATVADRWRSGLAEWGISEADVAAYRAGHRIRIYTPGSSAGIPLNLLASLRYPGGDFEAQEEDLREEIDTVVASLLGFAGLDADPVASRDYILLFNLIERAWRAGEDLSLEALIGQVAAPPIEKVGALPLDVFYPRKERNGLAFALNNLVASPAFESWREGEPIDIEAWVRAPGGLPQLTIISTAHLDDDRRMVVTAQVLMKLKTWMRRQPGTGELRALFYMDEIFGYFPPTANPPTKAPLLTLLKQARAYGLGVLLSTQNPVDLDYKGLANMGFWAIGRLQTAQDQERVRQGIEAALADADGDLDFRSLIAAVEKRVFLIHDIHRPAPELVHSRWAMSYLRGPLARDEIRRLIETDPRLRDAAPAAVDPRSDSETLSAPPATAAPPIGGLTQRYWARTGSAKALPYLAVRAAVRYKIGTMPLPEEVREVAFALDPAHGPAEWIEGEMVTVNLDRVADEPPAGMEHGEVPAFVLGDDAARLVERALRSRLDDRFAVEVLYDPETRTYGMPSEDPFAFARRIAALPALATKRRQVETRLAAKRADYGTLQADLSGRRAEKWASVGTSILSNLGMLGGRRRRVTGLGSIASKNRMESTAERRLAALQEDIAALERQIDALREVDASRFEFRVVKPAQAAIAIQRFELLWVY